METSTEQAISHDSFRYTWWGGLAGGIIGGVGMGIILHAGANMMHLIGALYGWPTVLGGWLLHLANSVILGILFALLVTHPRLADQTRSVLDSVVFGIIYAAAIGLITGGIMLPITLSLIGARALPDPALPIEGVFGVILVVASVAVAHLVYGLLLGFVYGRISNLPYYSP